MGVGYCLSMLHPVVDEAIDSLLVVWRHYDDVLRRRSDHTARAAARARLDTERMRVHRLRRGLHPEPRELEDVALSTACPSLAAPVFIHHGDLTPDGGFVCPCGSEVAAAFPDQIQ